MLEEEISFPRSGHVVSWLRRAPISKLFAPSPYASHCWGWCEEGNGRRVGERRILNPHGSQSLDPEETKGRYILPLRFPFSRHPRRCPPAQRRFLIRSRRFVHSAQRHVRRYSPLIFAIPWQKTAEGGERRLEFPLPTLDYTHAPFYLLFIRPS